MPLVFQRPKLADRARTNIVPGRILGQRPANYPSRGKCSKLGLVHSAIESFKLCCSPTGGMIELSEERSFLCEYANFAFPSRAEM